MAKNRNNRMGAQRGAGYGTPAAGYGTPTAGANRSAFEFATELGANTPAAGAFGTNQANRVGRNAQQTTANLRGKYGGR
jgi:hypothetical protein